MSGSDVHASQQSNVKIYSFKKWKESGDALDPEQNTGCDQTRLMNKINKEAFWVLNEKKKKNFIFYVRNQVNMQFEKRKIQV